ncbi:hypothetical protein KO481_18280 [Nocardia sp. NEAU-G5]|uniref:DUF8020 domain-containing protein n=1 Tax=Nocardia albiluteola TaxID=2842303 RepID=A0ABS6AZJ1_9NOCA|nr:hypothetical protein [Nocardia albiluteola]MBU3063471.1 hypothetical protein [Nocardia albiluteola]
MSLRSAALTAALAACVATATATTAHAAPAPASPVLHYVIDRNAHTLTGTIDNGRFALVDRNLVVRDYAGNDIATVPLDLDIGGVIHAVGQQISDGGRSLRITAPVVALKPVASPLEDQLAMNDLINSVNFGMSAGAIAGTAIGALIGTGVGVLVAGATCLVISVACVLAVLPIVALAGGVGGVLGLAAGGAPGVLVGAANYVQTMLAPPGQSKYASQIPALAPQSVPSR